MDTLGSIDSAAVTSTKGTVRRGTRRGLTCGSDVRIAILPTSRTTAGEALAIAADGKCLRLSFQTWGSPHPA
jgi:hypothetical protein